MRLRLLIDEDTQDARLVSLLRAAGHNVLTVNEAGLTGQPDSAVLAYAAQNHRIVLTMNCRDFLESHDASVNHAGIAAIYKGSDPRKNMTFGTIAAAFANLSASGWDFAGQFVVLNAWNYQPWFLLWHGVTLSQPSISRVLGMQGPAASQQARSTRQRAR